MNPKEQFPADFLWSASTSAWQFEGGALDEGKGPSVQDVRPGQREILRTASDHLHHLEEDVALLKALGLKAYRFSISWSRVAAAGAGASQRAGTGVLCPFDQPVEGKSDRTNRHALS